MPGEPPPSPGRGPGADAPAGHRGSFEPARRALATAAAIATGRPGSAVIVDERWRETDFGIAEGRTFDELATLEPALAAPTGGGRDRASTGPAASPPRRSRARRGGLARPLAADADGRRVARRAAPAGHGRSAGDMPPRPSTLLEPAAFVRLVPPTVGGPTGPVASRCVLPSAGDATSIDRAGTRSCRPTLRPSPHPARGRWRLVAACGGRRRRRDAGRRVGDGHRAGVRRAGRRALEPGESDEPSRVRRVRRSRRRTPPTSRPTSRATEPTPVRRRPASACSGTAENQDFYAAVAAAVSGPSTARSCRTGWFVAAGQVSPRRRRTTRDQLSRTQRRELHAAARARSAVDPDGCVPGGTELGAAAFGDSPGTPDLGATTGRGRSSVDAGANPSWLLGRDRGRLGGGDPRPRLVARRRSRARPRGSRQRRPRARTATALDGPLGDRRPLGEA